MISATLTSGIIDGFNSLLSEFIILTSFIPMITGTGGNSGSQASTVVIRALATGEIGLSDAFAVIFKEFRVAIYCGAALGVVNFARMVFLKKVSFNVALLVFLTIFLTVLLARVLGATLPILAKRVNLDPAIMASAVITTILDSVILVIYFLLAGIILFNFS